MTKQYFLFLFIAVCVHLLMYFCLSGNVEKKIEQKEIGKPKAPTFRMVDLPNRQLAPPVKEKAVVPKVPKKSTAPKENRPSQAEQTIENVQPAAATEQTDTTSKETNIDNSTEGSESDESDEFFFNAAEVSVLPSLPTRALRQRLHYPKEARQRGIEGIAYLQLYINSKGVVEKVEILHEKPDSSYGFGAAAKNALLGLKGTPAKYNGKAVGVIFRYPVRFALEK